MNTNNINYLIGEAKKKNREVCAWGTGVVARNTGYEILKQIGISVDAFFDNYPESRTKGTKSTDIPKAIMAENA